jgi:hypothetical protein
MLFLEGTLNTLMMVLHASNELVENSKLEFQKKSTPCNY